MTNRNERALKSIAITVAALTYAGAVIYGDIMFLQVMNRAFPGDGILRLLAMSGAIVTAVSAVVLPVALHWWFAPGLQFIWGAIFWMLDIAALAFNSILAYEVASGAPLDSVVALWQLAAPATPLLAVIGWGIAFLLDPSHQERHARAELQADQIDIYASEMRKAARSEEVFAMLRAAAVENARQFAESIRGRRIEPAARPPAIGQGVERSESEVRRPETVEHSQNGNSPKA